MAVTSTQGAGGNSAVPVDPPKIPPKVLKPDDFIKLFLAQMRHQDPTHPADSSTILQQMAQISSIQASNSLQDSMSALSESVKSTMASTQMLQATQLIDKNVQVVAPAGMVPFTEKDGLSGSIYLQEPASRINITIRDSSGKVLRTLHEEGSSSSGLVDFKWDGKGDDGTTTYKPGVYNVTATAEESGKTVPAEVIGAYKVHSVALDKMTNRVVLNVDQLGGIDIDAVVKVL